MGVYINGMEMPQRCPSCPFNSRAWYEESHLCLAKNEQIKVNLNTGFDDNCPLVNVPPHGRLIDADDLANSITGAIYHSDLRDAPTIIPADHIGDGTKMVNAEEGE